ncbi:RNA polymerase sigma factor [Christiangramia sabulilitoris]|uniref:Sigma-70 family RNA polymerase sigma factor n=1 Tax=Christiangramia sabulilitoris TaxID=2583991 RepID=A0A550I7I6_9FLAO|nr:sigma-70 family RNA polymerase sigma factor [Christiangramia sabulilitoris]TRO66788.1 sigma-70 family RNA polymerase sigma factor [Christiangramia sabulilitoris]
MLEKNKEKIYRICKIYAVSPIEPEDLFQEVTYQIWKALSTFENKSTIDTWVYRITLNVCIRSKNKLNRFNDKSVRLETINFQPTSIYPDQDLEKKYKALQECINTLSKINQAIVIFSLEDLPYKEIAKITGLTENHVAVKMKRIRKELLDCLISKID